MIDWNSWEFIKDVGAPVGVAALPFIFAWLKRLSRGIGGGSPNSRRYWESRLNSDLDYANEAKEFADSGDFESRAKVARWNLDAFDAVKVMGSDGRRNHWLLFAMFLILSFFSFVTRAPWYVVLASVILMILSELGALKAGDIKNDQVSVLTEAARWGHSGLVQSNPWVLIATFEKYNKIMEGNTAEGGLTWADQRGGKNVKMWLRDEFIVKYGPPVGAQLGDIWREDGTPSWEKYDL